MQFRAWAIILLSAAGSVFGASRTSPPSGALVVRAGTTATGEFKTITSAINSVSASTPVTVFVYGGTYNEQIYITRAGAVTILGYTTDTLNYAQNVVNIQNKLSAADAGSNDASGTLRVHQNGFKAYNINVKNTYGQGSQAIAISQYGSKVGLYACGFYGYQDTLLANEGTQVYLRGYIEGATDFIFGRRGLAFFGGNTIRIIGAGWVTASGRESNDSGSYVFDKNTIVSSLSSAGYLGRPWGAYAKVIFKNTVVTAALNKAIWSQWNTGDPRTSNVLFAEYNSSGSGVSGASRPSFAKVLSASEAAQYTIASAVGSDYASWVDSAYLV